MGSKGIVCLDYYGREIKSKVRPILKNGHMVHRITVPKGYLKPDPVVTLPGVEVDEIVWCWIDPKTAKGPALEEACASNLYEAMCEVWLRGNDLEHYMAEKPPISKAQDRCYFKVCGGDNLVRDIRRTGTFEEADGSLHHPHEPGWEYVGSWKTTRRPPPVLQITLWERDGDFVAEMDLDLHAGASHVFEALKNELTGSLTHPYVANQAMARWHGIVSFRLEPGRKP